MYVRDGYNPAKNASAASANGAGEERRPHNIHRIARPVNLANLARGRGRLTLQIPANAIYVRRLTGET